MAEVDNLLDFGSPTTEDQNQVAAEPTTGNLLDFDNHEDSAIESQSAVPDLETEKTTTAAIEEDAEPEPEATESQEPSEPVGAECQADLFEPVEETSNAQSPLEPPESVSEQQQEQQEQPIVELDSPTPVDTRGMEEQEQQHQEEDAGGAAIDFGSIQSADGHSVAHTEEVKVDADVDVDVDTRADPSSAFDNRQYEVESSGSGVAISLRPKSEHDWSTSTKAVAMQYNSSSSSSATATAAAAATGAASSQFKSSCNGSSSDVCRLCRKKVYPMELLTSDGHMYHKSCYRCHKCNRLLSVGNFGVLDNQLYCQPHYLEIFRIRGHYQASSDRPQPDIVGGDNQVDDGLSQVQKLSDLKSRFESAGDSSQQRLSVVGSRTPSSPRRASSPAPAAASARPVNAASSVGGAANGVAAPPSWSREPRRSSPSLAGVKVVVTPPTAGGRPQPAASPARSPPVHSTVGSNGNHSSAEVVRSGDATLAEGELPPPGASKNVLAMFRNMEMGGQHPARDEEHQPARQKGRPAPAAALDRRASVPLQKSQQQQPLPPLQKQTSSSAQQQKQIVEQPDSTDSIVRESDINDILPQQGTAKALLSVWRGKELQKQQTQQQEQQLLQKKRQSLAFDRSPSASSLSAAASSQSAVRRQSSHSQGSGAWSPRRPEPSGHAQRRPYQPEPNMDFDYTAPVPSSAASESHPTERPADLVRSGDPNPADELPPANFTRSALQMWKDKEGQGGRAAAPNPEASERLRLRARETSGVNNNIRLPGGASAAASAVSGDAPDAAPAAPRDESSENRPSTPPAEVARWGSGEAGGDEMPKQGTTQNLRSMFSGGQ